MTFSINTPDAARRGISYALISIKARHHADDARIAAARAHEDATPENMRSALASVAGSPFELMLRDSLIEVGIVCVKRLGELQ